MGSTSGQNRVWGPLTENLSVRILVYHTLGQCSSRPELIVASTVAEVVRPQAALGSIPNSHEFEFGYVTFRVGH
jgi:hypothetical protein